MNIVWLLKASQVMHHFVAFITESLLFCLPGLLLASVPWIGAMPFSFCFK